MTQVNDEENKVAQPLGDAEVAHATPAHQSPKKGMLLTNTHRIWMGIGMFMIGLAVVVAVVRTVVDNRSTAIAHAVMQQYAAKGSEFEIAIIDPVKLVDTFRAQGADELQAYRALALFLSILEEDNIIAIESRNAITAPDNSMIKAIPYTRIEEMAKSRGVDIEKYQDDMIQQAREQAEEVMRQLTEVYGEFEQTEF